MQNTNLNTNPYFDDFNKNKNFYKVLFRPGYPVQSRELTTLQSILQNQIENFGNSIYKDGAMVIPGQVGYDLNYRAVKIENAFNGIPVERYRESLVGLVIRGATTNIQARVIDTLSATDPSNTSGNIVLYVKYLNSSTTDNTTSFFQSDENLIASENIVIGTTTILNTSSFAKTISSNPNSIGSCAFVNEGVYYIRGYFVNVPSQSLILDPFGVTPSYKIGLQIQENIVTPEEDLSLYDNAIGSSNFTAPGAHRFQIQTSLVKKDIDDPDTANFIELLRLKSGEVQYFLNRTSFSELEKEIARRTFSTNGDYTVVPFDVSVRECLNNGLNNGVYGAGTSTTQGTGVSESKLAVQISPGSAFVKGYEVQSVGTRFLDADKARISTGSSNQSVTNTFGSFVEVDSTDLKGIFDLSNNIVSVEFYNQYFTSANSASGQLVGTAKLIDITKELSVIPSNGIIYRLYLTDIKFNSGKSFSDVKAIGYITNNDDEDSYANLRTTLNDRSVLSGSLSIPVVASNSNGTLTGFSSNFLAEIKVGDILFAPSGTSGSIQRFEVVSVSSNTSATIKNLSPISSVANSYTFTRARPRLENSTNSTLFTQLPKKYIKSLSVNSIVVRSQSKNVVATNNVISLTAPAGYTFTNTSDILISDSNKNLVTTYSPSNFGGSLTITISGNFVGPFDIAYSLAKSNPVHRAKIPQLMKILSVSNPQSSNISLGIPDVYKVHSILESNNSNDPIIPSFEYTIENGIIDNFSVGEIIKGSSSSAVGRIVSKTQEGILNKINFVYISQNRFTNSELITGLSSNTPANITNINNGSSDITAKFDLNDGQQDQLYNFSSIVRKSGESAPVNKIFVIFDYFEHGNTGDFFNVNSYPSYNEIPNYKTNSLSDVIDYRYSVIKTINGSGSIDDPFINVGGTTQYRSFNPLKSGSDLICSFEYYLPRIDKLILNNQGIFRLISGSPSETPSAPTCPDDSMQIADIYYPAYTSDLSKIKITKFDNRRYTMKDIYGLEQRIKNIEYYTQLNLLELDTERMTVSDANGFQRFKNGFLVDNFTDNSKSDVLNPDFECAVDPRESSLRPSHYTSNVPLVYNQSESNNIQRSQNILTLPYTSVVSIEQSKASRVENVNPFNVVAWIGNITLSPSSDDWVDTTRAADQVTNIEGDYATAARLINADNNGFSPTTWGEWETTWTGQPTVTATSGRFVAPGSGRRPFLVTDTLTTRGNRSRTGTRTRITPRTDTFSVGDRVISRTAINFIRSRNITFIANRLKPKTRFYPFFDGVSVSSFVMPQLVEISMLSGTFSVNETLVGETSDARVRILAPNNNNYRSNPYSSTDSALPSTYSTNSTVLNIDLESLSSTVSQEFYKVLISGETIRGVSSGARARVSNLRLVSDPSGYLSGSFFIPSPNDDTNPRFQTGSRTFRLTTSDTNGTLEGSIDSSAQVNYASAGVLETVQNNIISVRNATLTEDTINETETDVVLSTTTRNRQVGWYDPLAESFLVVSRGGEFLTGVDLYFQTKDDANIPVSVQIRTMSNGYPTRDILPFTEVSLRPDQVSVSQDSTIPTRFNFEAPVYVEENEEYALVVLSNSNKYRVWISRMGENDILTSLPISNQPYTGVLFKSQNASTWTADQYEDLKFKLYRAEFSSLTGTAVFNNGNTENLITLRNNPISTTAGSNILTIYHSNHGMHSSNVDRVTISGVKSEIPPTSLVNEISATGNVSTITVVNASQFHTTIGGSPVSASNPGFIKIDNEIFSYSSISENVINIVARNQSGSTQTSHSVGVLVECYNLSGIPLTEINTTKTISNPTLDTYQINTTKNANVTLRTGGSECRASQNVRYEVLTPQIQTVNINNTNVNCLLNTTTGKSIDGNETAYILETALTPVSLNESNYFTTPKLIASRVNELYNLNSSKSFKLNLNLSSTLNNLSPVIDLDRTSLITTTNRIRGINGYVVGVGQTSISTGSTLATGDPSKAVYITKLVRLNNPASSLKVMFSAWRPNGAVIDVYYKVVDSNLQQDISNIGYTKFSTSTSDSSIPDPNDQEDYLDYEFNANNLNFGAFAIKVVMRSNSQVNVPIIKDFRVMALS